jgi:ferredoxin
MGESLRVSVDPKSCVGSGYCQRIAPEIFRIDESNLAHVLQPEVPPELEELAREAEDTCPANAIATKE